MGTRALELTGTAPANAMRIVGLQRDRGKVSEGLLCRGDFRHSLSRIRGRLIQGQPVVLPASLWPHPDYVRILRRMLE